MPRRYAQAHTDSFAFIYPSLSAFFNFGVRSFYLQHLDPQPKVTTSETFSRACVPLPMMAWALNNPVPNDGMCQVLARMWTETLHSQTIAFNGFGYALIAYELERLDGLVAVPQEAHEPQVENVGLTVQRQAHRQ